jgi:stage II sporulation protein D
VRRLAGVLVALGLTVVASSASAATWTFSGAGFGHGVGLSQYGAFGLAQQGWGHRRILSHYYRGTRIGRAQGRSIRVLLQDSRTRVSVRGARAVGGRRVGGGRIVVRPGRRGLRVSIGRGKPADPPSPVRIEPSRSRLRLDGDALNGVAGGRYRGALEIHLAKRRLSVVNRIDLDDYVQGVVPSEMPSTWHVQALRAQAVVARSYALATDVGGSLFDQYPDTRSQVYRGVTAEVSRVTDAVQATAGEVVEYRGRIATTYYFSTSGGATESVENAFPGAGPVPYLSSVADPHDDLSPRHRWTMRLTGRAVRERLGRLVRGELRRIEVVRRGRTPRIVEARIVGSKGSRLVHGMTLRVRLGLPSTWFTTRRG